MQYIGAKAICVQLDQHTKLFYPGEEKRQILMQCWLAAGNAYAGEYAAPFLQKRENFIL